MQQTRLLLPLLEQRAVLHAFSHERSKALCRCVLLVLAIDTVASMHARSLLFDKTRRNALTNAIVCPSLLLLSSLLSQYYERHFVVVDTHNRAEDWPKKLEDSDHIIASYAKVRCSLVLLRAQLCRTPLPAVALETAVRLTPDWCDCTQHLRAIEQLRGSDVKSSPLKITAAIPYAGPVTGACQSTAARLTPTPASSSSSAAAAAEAHDVLVFPDNVRVHDVSEAHSASRVACLLARARPRWSHAMPALLLCPSLLSLVEAIVREGVHAVDHFALALEKLYVHELERETESTLAHMMRCTCVLTCALHCDTTATRSLRQSPVESGVHLFACAHANRYAMHTAIPHARTHTHTSS